MNKGLMFFLAVMALYAFFILRGAVRAVRARVEKLSARKYSKAQATPRPKRNPYKKSRIDADVILDFIEAKLKRLSGEDPIMSTRINKGSERFFEQERALRESRSDEIGSLPYLWSQSLHKSWERERLVDARPGKDRKTATATDKEPDAGS
jgi:hypothetical protein